MIKSLETRLRESYFPKDTFQHRKANLIRLFPYITTSIAESDKQELATYIGLCGEVARRIASVKKMPPFGTEELRNALQDRVETNELDYLLDIIKSIAFDDKDMVLPFSISAYPYLSFAKEKAILRDYGLFIYEVFWGVYSDNPIKYNFLKDKDNNIIHSLLSECFPQLEIEATKSSMKYTNLDVGLHGVFLADWTFLSTHTEHLQSYFPMFLKLYSLLYQLRAVELLNNHFKEKSLDPIYFTLEWESCSKGRSAYQLGWKRLEGQVRKIFSHVNTLELLNHISIPNLESPFTYVDILHWCEDADQSKKDEAIQSLDYLITFYRQSIKPRVGWEQFEPFESNNHECEVINKAVILFEMVDCQFRNSVRNANASRYANWLIQSTVNNFCRMRGRIGRTLAFNKEQLLLLTRLAVGDKDKLRLHEYWNELEKRGIAFDFESRRKIVELFEQLNLLEKKSDSGDAQYVRAII